MTHQRVGFVGLGTMGRPMTRRLLRAGYQVTVWNRSPEPVAELVADGATAAGDLSEVFAQPLVLSILADDTSVRERILTSGVLDGAGCRVHVNLATVSTALADEAAGLHAALGIGYVAAPVLGRADVAAAGKLNVLAAGAPDAVRLARPALQTFAAKVWELGPEPSQANVVKIAMNFLLASAITSTAEAVSLVESYQVDAAEFVKLVGSTVFPGPVYSGYGGLMASRQYEPAGFSTRLGLKDTRLALQAAHQHQLALPIASLIQDSLLQAIAAGWSERDWATLAEVARGRRGTAQ